MFIRDRIWQNVMRLRDHAVDFVGASLRVGDIFQENTVQLRGVKRSSGGWVVSSLGILCGWGMNFWLPSSSEVANTSQSHSIVLCSYKRFW